MEDVEKIVKLSVNISTHCKPVALREGGREGGRVKMARKGGESGGRGGGEEGKIRDEEKVTLTSGILTSTRVGRASNIFFTLRIICREEGRNTCSTLEGKEKEEG